MRKVFLAALALVVMAVMLPGCSSRKSEKSAKLDPFAGVGSPHYKGKGPVPAGGGRYHVGKPYQVAGRWFTPREQPGYDKKGLSSWYGEAFHRRKTSNGEWFDMNRLTAAHATLPLPSYAKVTNLNNGKSVIVRINDRGPFVDTRVLDVSKRTADALGYLQKGTETVRVQYIGPAPLDDNGSHLLAMNKELERGVSLNRMIAQADREAKDGVTTITHVAAAPSPPVESRSFTRAAPEPEQAPEQPYQTAGMSYFIAAGSFSDADNVERLRQELNDVGPVQVMEITGTGQSIYRVRVGPMSSRAKAESLLGQVQARGLGDARVIETRMQQASLR